MAAVMAASLAMMGLWGVGAFYQKSIYLSIYLARGADMTMGYTRRCVYLRLRAFVCVGALPALI